VTTPAGDEKRHAAGGRWSDHEIEQVIGRLLQAGVFVAAAVTIAGALALLVRHGGERADFSVFRGAAKPLRDLSAIMRGVAMLDGRSIVQLGLLLLIATPVARVALTFVAFVVQRDRLYVLVTAVVLGLLLWGLVG
jgi:uncharacterized membrane protein